MPFLRVMTFHSNNMKNNRNIYYQSAENFQLSFTRDTMSIETAVASVFKDPAAYFYSRREGESDCLMYRWIAVCPICGETQPAHVKLRVEPEETISAFVAWALQVTMPFIIKDPLFAIGEWEVPDILHSIDCANCGHSGYTSELFEMSTVETDESMVILKHQARGKRYRLPKQEREASLKLLCEKPGAMETLTDEIVFDTETGIVKEVISENGDCREYDITVSGAQGWLTERYHCNPELQKNLLEALGENIAWDSGEGEEDAADASLTEVIHRFRFRGYPSSFIRSFPDITSEEEQNRICDSVQSLPLHYADIAEAFLSLDLPQKKQLQKIIYSNPALVLYSNEIRNLPFNNYDVRLKILASNMSLALLSTLFRFPEVRGLIEAYISVKGEAKAWDSISRHIRNLPIVAAMWEFKRPPVITPGLLRGDIRDLHSRLKSGFENKIFSAINYSEKEMALQGSHHDFRFVLPRSTRTIQKAANRLNNCLVSYTEAIMEHRTTVYLVTHSEQFVAAIEVNMASMRVIQAYGVNDVPIDERTNKSLYRAVNKWTQANGIRHES
jgi:hypothetical protein